MENKTAIEWLFETMAKTPMTNWYEIREQAKAMEKEQIMKAVYDGMGTNFDPNMGRAEEYFNETFNK